MTWKDYMTADEKAEYKAKLDNINALREEVADYRQDLRLIADRCRKRMERDV